MAQWYFLRKIAMPSCEGFLMFQEQTSSPSSGCAGCLVETKLFSALYDNGDIVPEMSENFHILLQLSARVNFIEFCRRESFKTCKECVYCEVPMFNFLFKGFRACSQYCTL
jgi:hypothetical protein